GRPKALFNNPADISPAHSFEANLSIVSSSLSAGPSSPSRNAPPHPTHQVNLPVEFPLSPATIDLAFAQGKTTSKQVLLELEDGSSFTGFSFGAAKSVSGELVFQTGLTPSHLLAWSLSELRCRNGRVSRIYYRPVL